MRDSKRISKILERLEKIWEKYPDLRLGQLITNVVRDPTLYYLEDDELLEFLEKFYMAP